MIVDIKGVGQAQFPDDMAIADIRSFLRNKYYQREAQGQSDILSPQPQTASPYEPTLTERLGGGIAEGLKGAGLISDNYGAQQIGKNVTALGEFLPGIGDASAGDEFGRAVAEGDNLGMGLAALGAIPIAGDLAKQTLRKAKSINLPSGKLGSDQYKLIKQSDPKAKTKTNPDGTVNVTYLEEYQPKQLKGPLHEFDPDALELSEGTFKNTDTYRGDKDKPITVTKQNGDYVILDGHHRAKIAKQEGRNVKAVVLPIEDVAEMKKDNIHQADMRKEWIARGNYKPEEASQSLPMDEAKDLNVIYSGTMGDAATEVIPYGIHKDSKNNKVSNIFGGIFGSFDENVASSHGGNIQKILTDKHVSHSDMIHDVFYNDEISWDSTVGKVRSILDGHKKYTVNKATDDELEEIIDYMMESKSIYDGEPDMGYDRFNDITGSYVSEDDYESFGDVSWDMQGLKGELGRRMGYDSIGMPDEHGESVLVLNALSINGKPINQNLPTDKK